MSMFAIRWGTLLSLHTNNKDNIDSRIYYRMKPVFDHQSNRTRIELFGIVRHGNPRIILSPFSDPRTLFSLWWLGVLRSRNRPLVVDFHVFGPTKNELARTGRAFESDRERPNTVEVSWRRKAVSRQCTWLRQEEIMGEKLLIFLRPQWGNKLIEIRLTLFSSFGPRATYFAIAPRARLRDPGTCPRSES